MIQIYGLNKFSSFYFIST